MAITLSNTSAGAATLQGFAWPCDQKVFRRPDGLDLVYYSFELQKLETKGAGRSKVKEWVTVHRKKMDPPFLIVDPSGAAKVSMNDQVGVEGLQEQIRVWKDLSDADQVHFKVEFLKDFSHSGFPPEQGFSSVFGAQFRIRELSLCVGAPIQAQGLFKPATAQSEAKKAQSLNDLGLLLFAEAVFDHEAQLIKSIDTKSAIQRAQLLRQKSSAGQAPPPVVKGAPLPEISILGILENSEGQALRMSGAIQFQELVAIKPNYHLKGGLAFLVVAAGLWLGPISWLTRPVEGHRSMSSQAEMLNPLELHQNCLNAGTASCLTLLQHQKELKLSSEQISYYARQACLPSAEPAQCEQAKNLRDHP